MRFDMESSRILNLKCPEQIHGESVSGVIISVCFQSAAACHQYRSSKLHPDRREFTLTGACSAVSALSAPSVLVRLVHRSSNSTFLRLNRNSLVLVRDDHVNDYELGAGAERRDTGLGRLLGGLAGLRSFC
jgi:hypothetical protein